MKRMQVVKIEMVKEKSLMYEYKQINSPKDAANIIKLFLNNVDREMFVVMCLDTKNNINSLNVVSTGTLNSAMVHPREVFKTAILSNANSIILAHNHPSGDPTPSREDVTVTQRLVEAGKLLGIEVLDHVIIGDGDKYISFKEKEIID